METLSKYEDLRQVAEAAFKAWSACNALEGVELVSVEDELEWEDLIEAMGTLGAVLREHAKQ